MNTKNKTGKFRIIFRFLKGNIRFFVERYYFRCCLQHVMR